MRSKIILSILLLSTIVSTGCSILNKKNSTPKVQNILTGAFADTHGSADESTNNGSLKNIKDAQAQGSDFNLSKQISKKTILKKLTEIGAGTICECEYQGKSCFSVDFNNTKLPTKIIDDEGNISATCDYNDSLKKEIDPMCDALKKCKLVYVSDNNVRGYNPIDKYGINK